VDVVLEVGVMTAEELLARYAAGERDFSGVDLSGCVLEEVCLDEINLERANLQSILIFRSTLRGAIFSKADLEGADLSMSVLDETSFREANLTNCRTLECSMIRADFQNARTDGMIWDGYAYNTVMPDGRIVSDPDAGRDQRIAEGHEF
jgi:uncharacterized protein YjbI with pentapeptide repeats